MVSFGEVRIPGYLPLAGGRMFGDIEMGGHRITSADGDVKSSIDFVGTSPDGNRAIRLQALQGPDNEDLKHMELDVVPGQGVKVHGTGVCTLDVQGEVKAKSLNVEQVTSNLEMQANALNWTASGNSAFMNLRKQEGGENALTMAAANEGGTYQSWVECRLWPEKGLVVEGQIDGEPGTALDVNGTVKAKAIKINDWTLEQRTGDFVFDSSYALPSLEDMEAYVKKERHLPEMPSAKQIGKEGLDLVEMNLVLLKRVEELLLHTIDQGKKIDTLNKKSAEQQTQIEALEGALNRE